MALEIFKLVGSIFVDTDKANESLKKTDKQATSVAEGLGKAGKVAAGAAVAIGTAIVGTGTALVGMAKDTAAVADEVDKASIRMGISTEKYQELAYAAGQCGVEMSTMEQAAKKLEGTDMTFDEAIEQIMALGTAEERSAMAAELFGEKVAYNLSPLIEQSGESFDGLIKRSHELGLVMSEDAVKAGVAFGDLSSDLEQSFGMLKTNLGAALFPVLNQVIEKLIEFMPTIQELGQQLGPIASDFIEKLIPPLADMAGKLLPVILDSISEILPLLSEIVGEIIPVLVDMFGELTPILVDIVKTVLPVVSNLLKLILPLVSALLKALTPLLGAVLSLLTPLLELISAILTPILELLNVLLEPLLMILNTILVPLLAVIGYIIEPLTAMLNAILTPLLGLLGELIKPLLEILNECLKPIMKVIKDFYAWSANYGKKAWNWLSGFFNFVAQNIGTKLSSVFNSFGNVVARVWESIKASFRNGVNFWISALNTLIRGLNMLKVPDWVTNATGIRGVNIREIPMLAEGGNIEAAGRVIVGEAGPEMLELPRGAKVTPLTDNMDYGKLAAVIVDALREVAPELATNVNVSGNKDRIVDIVVDANKRSLISRGRGIITT